MNEVLLLGVLVGVSAPALKGPPKNQPAIVGEWVLASVTARGKDCELMTKGARIDITADGRWINHTHDADAKGVDAKSAPSIYVLNPKAEPPTIDVGEQVPGVLVPVRALHGIYQSKGDTIIICFSVLSNEHPKSFEPTDDGSSLYLHLVLTRVKKK